jgi:hypothetical protein
MKGDYSMSAPGSGILKVTSILLIVFGAIAVIAFITLLLVTSLSEELINENQAGLFALIMAMSLFGLVISVLELVLGIIGLTKCKNPNMAAYFIVVGIVLCAFSLIDIVSSFSSYRFSFISLINIVLSILYIIGGSMNKRILV